MLFAGASTARSARPSGIDGACAQRTHCSYVLAAGVPRTLKRGCTTLSVTSCSNSTDGRIFSEAVFAPLFLSACARPRDAARDRAPESNAGFHTRSIEAHHWHPVRVSDLRSAEGGAPPYTLLESEKRPPSVR
jgi:hypothetical protein